MEEKNSVTNIKTAIRIFLSLAGIVLGIWLIIKLGLYFLPFVIGWILALIAGPLVRFLENKLKIKRKAGSVIATVVILLIICAIIYFTGAAIIKRGALFAEKLPGYYQSVIGDLKNTGDELGRWMGKLPQSIGNKITEGLENIEISSEKYISGLGEKAVDTVGKIISKFPYYFICVIVVVFSAYYFMSQHSVMKKAFAKLFPGSIGEKMRFIASELKKGVGGYFKAQFIIMIVIFAILTIAFAILKIPFGPLWAILIALLDFLPFFGTGFVLIPWAVVRIFNGDYKMAIVLCILYIVCLVVHQALQPSLLSDKMEINPILTLIFLFVGYKMGGVIGIFLGLLIGMVIVNLYRAGVFDDRLADCKSLIENLKKWLTKKPD